MSNCKYCGKNVGLLKKTHSECVELYNKGISEIRKIPLKYDSNIIPDGTLELAAGTGKKYYISEHESKTILLDEFKEVIKHLLSDELLSEKNEQIILSINKLFPEIIDNEKRLKIVQESIIRELLNGNIPSNRIRLEGGMPFELMKDETVVYLFKSSSLAECKDSAVRPLGFQPSPLNKGIYMERLHFFHIFDGFNRIIKAGDLYITNRNIYLYDGNNKGLKDRFSYDDINFLVPYDDWLVISIGFYAHAFKVDNSWFAFNLVNNLMRMWLPEKHSTPSDSLATAEYLIEKIKNDFSINEKEKLYAAHNKMQNNTIGITSSENNLENQLLKHKAPALHFSRLLDHLDAIDDFNICEKIFSIVETNNELQKDYNFLFFYYINKINIYYKNRDAVNGAFDKAMESCINMIKATKPLSCSNSKKNISENPSHPGYKQLAIIYHKQGKYDEVIKLCEQAKSEWWKGDWDKRIEAAKIKLEKGK